MKTKFRLILIPLNVINRKTLFRYNVRTNLEYYMYNYFACTHFCFLKFDIIKKKFISTILDTQKKNHIDCKSFNSNRILDPLRFKIIVQTYIYLIKSDLHFSNQRKTNFCRIVAQGLYIFLFKTYLIISQDCLINIYFLFHRKYPMILKK